MTLKLNDHDLSKQIIILTGATDGIGKEMARILSGFNPRKLILPIRNKEKGNNLLEYIKSSNGHTNNIELWEIDLNNLQSVKDFANKFINEVGELHMLFNNAGIWASRRILKTNNNLEKQFQVNYLAPFLLTLLLLDTMKKSVSVELPGKIAFTSSLAYKFGEIDFDNLNLEKGYYWNAIKAYGNTKLMSLIASKELSRRISENENIAVYSIHPGIIRTNIGRINNPIITFLSNLSMKLIAEAPEKGAINVLYPVLDPENKETGKYYNKGIKEETNELVDDQELAKKLWNVSEQILKDHGMI